MSIRSTDDSLAQQVIAGDERALAKVFRTYHQPLYRYCLAIVGNPHDAEDALQETMVKALRALRSERREIALKPWLYRIAHNESIDLLRHRRDEAVLSENEPAAGDGLAEQVETRQRLRQLIADLGELPDRQRGVLLMREAAGLDFEDIATALDTSVGVARQTLYEARLGLRRMETGRAMECAAVTRALSDSDRRLRRRRDIRAHLRGCGDCRGFVGELDSRRRALAAIPPLPAVAATAMLHGLIGGSGASASAGGGGTGVGTLIGGSAAKSIGTVPLLKATASVALIAAIGIGVADKGGLIRLDAHRSVPEAHSAAPIRSAAAGRGDPRASVAIGATSSQAAGARSADPTGSHTTTTKARTRRAVAAAPATTLERRQSRVANAAATSAYRRAGEAPVAATEPAVEHSPTADPTPSPSPGAGEESTAPPEEPAPEHPHGRGHAKQTPPSAAHGQETAASHRPEKTSTPGSPAAKPSQGTGAEAETGKAVSSPGHSGEAGGAEHTAPPAHPVHPTTPSNPATPPTPEEAVAPPVAEESPAEIHGKKPEKP